MRLQVAGIEADQQRCNQQDAEQHPQRQRIDGALALRGIGHEEIEGGKEAHDHGGEQQQYQQFESHGLHLSSRVLKKASCLFQHTQRIKCDFSFAHKFKHLGCLNLPMHPCIGSRRHKSCAFQPPPDPACSKDRRSGQFKLLVITLGITLLPALAGLGVWQLQRATEKQHILAAYRAEPSLSRLPYSLPALPAGIRLSGRLLPTRYFLLDNRSRNGLPGYELVAVLRPDGEAQHLLVNLGWLAAPATREQLPRVSLPESPLSLQGWLVSAEPGFMLGREAEWPAGWPLRVQQPDLERMASQLELPLYPAMLRLSTPLLDGVDSHWKPVNMTPETHRAYALQWFAMLLMTAVWLLWWYRREERG